MKTLLFLFIAQFMCIQAAAQTNYYTTSKTFAGQGYSYRCITTSWGYVTLRNTQNVYTDNDYVYKDGSRVTDIDLLQGYIDLIEDDDWTKQACFAIVNNAFSAAEKARIKGKIFFVTMTVDTNTGKVIEVDFNFLTTEPFATIPFTVYRAIEVGLKANIWFTLTDAGKQLKFIIHGWMHEVQ